jgi:hypothetical protein
MRRANCCLLVLITALACSRGHAFNSGSFDAAHVGVSDGGGLGVVGGSTAVGGVGEVGEGGIPAGGNGGSGSVEGLGGASGTQWATGGAMSAVGPDAALDGATGVSVDGGCNVVLLWAVVTQSFCGSSNCVCLPDQTDGGSSMTKTFVLTLDGSGRISGDTLMSALGDAGVGWMKWVDSVPNYVWPCLAGSVIPYTCDVGE